MTQNTDLINLPDDQTVSVYNDDAAFLDLSKTASSFLPRLQLFGSTSALVKEGKMPLAHWGFVSGKDDVVDLGTEVDVIPVSIRFKAMDLSGGDVLSFYNPASTEFRDIQERSQDAESQCMAGNEFLVWVPDRKAFATFYASNSSSKQEAPKIKALLKKAATFKVKYVKGKRNSWHAPVVIECSDPITNIPTPELLQSTVETFRNPKDSEVTVAEPTKHRAQ